MISIGDNAPQFTLSTNGGGQFSLADAAGKYLILYFYPKDDTPGCTKEAIGFSEERAAFEAQNAMTRTAASAKPLAHGWKSRCMAKPIWASSAPRF